ncbi:MAG TPA: cob(I)yrinic acid a,c-diamide adenosyltransferase [Anaerolineales bacterium]|nr:cob(I)yrinic acid a,c-diamide adenosyltransferase [Anaerolineales bacterium]
MSFFTRRGDDGTTGLLGKGRVPKHDARIEAVGTLDEASAAMGLARAMVQGEGSAALLVEAQRDLYHVMAEVAATPESSGRFRFDGERVKWLEAQIERLSKIVKVPGEFIVPGDTPGEAALSMARAVVRRAERRLVELADKGKISNPELQRYVNRLSSLLFVLELAENKAAGKETTRAERE